MNLKIYKQKGKIIMTDFDLCMQALEQKGIEYELKAVGATDIFCVIAHTYGKPTFWYFYYKNGAEYKF